MPAAQEDNSCVTTAFKDSSVGTIEPQSTKKARRPRRPRYHKRLHPSHAYLPFVPEERARSRHRFWHFGWPVTETFVNNTIDIYIPEFLDDDHPPSVRFARFLDIAEGVTKYSPFRLVLAEPDAYTPIGQYQSSLADTGETAVTFCMVVSDARKSLFIERPTKQQMARLVSFFGAEPQWRMDAREKSLWPKYGHGN